MTRGSKAAVGTVFLGALVFVGGCNECDFLERCEGNTRQQCGGIDQQFGRKIDSTVCARPNPVCAEIGDATAVCAWDPVTKCGRDFVAYCQNGAVLSCSEWPEGVVVAEDCTRAGQKCGVGRYGQAACVEP
jgi:hypothetical protein